MALRLKLNDPAKAERFFETKMAFTTGPVELKYFIDHGESPNIIDVRAAEDFEAGHIPGAHSLPEDEWSTLKGLSKKQVNVVYCYSIACHLAARAALYFASKGFPVMELDGGISLWKKNNFKLEKLNEKKVA